MSKRRDSLVLLALLACGCGPTEPVWELAPPRQPDKIERLTFKPDGRPATMPTTFPARLSTTRPATGPTVRNITIVDCRQWALTNNLDMKVSVYSPQISKTLVSQQEAIFEPTFFTNANVSDTDQPIGLEPNALNRFNTQGVEPGINVPLRTGGQLTFSSPADRNAAPNFTTDYDAALVASITQPLLRNGGQPTAEYPIRIAGYNYQISRATARLQVTQVLATIDRVYWRLYAARRDLEVKKRQYDLAMALLEKAQREFRAGKGTEVDVIRAQSGVADRLDSIITAENVARERQRDLKRLLNQPDIDEDTTLIPASDPTPIHYALNTQQLLDLAMTYRAEMLQQELLLAQQALTIGFAKNQMLPLLSLVYSYRVSGLGNTVGSAYDQVFDNQFQGQALTLRLEVPLGNEAAKAQLRNALLTRLQQLSSKAAQALQIKKDVLDAADNLDAAWNRIIASRARTVLSARTLAAEQREFDNGVRTSTDVLNAITDLADAQSSEVSALTDYQIAQIDLAFATGTTLGQAKVDWEKQIATSQPTQ